MATEAEMGITLKINELPAGDVKDKNDGVQSSLDAKGQAFTMTVRPKIWDKLTQAQAEWPLWVASVKITRTL